MAEFIAKQPNGKYCRYSTVGDRFTDINMSKEDYVKLKIAQARKDAEYEIETCESMIPPPNMIQIIYGRGAGKSSKTLKLIDIFKKMNDPNGVYEKL